METFKSMRALGFGLFWSVMSIFIIHPAFSMVTAPYYLDPMMRIWTHNISNSKHGSDTGVYDTEGRFVPQKFEELFSKWDKQGQGFMTLSNFWTMTNDMKNVMDPFGWFAAKFEWFFTWLLCAD